MAGGYKAINKHPNAGSNNFKNNPQNINQKGAPKGKRVSTIIKEILERGDLSKIREDLKDIDDGKKALAIELLTIAFSNSDEIKTSDKLNAIKEVLDRTDGKATQTVETNVTVKAPPIFDKNGLRK
jgi:hypothetical protein